ncbi:acyltransferase [Pseudomonas savastanoi pv. phaseolicola]|uniref:acyltransferase family protein n=1 Tax=Pseudomonas savastanoi TaxID=29438 RepID=UPI0002D502E5|nr:acyltransferase [Pseudomonas savastanoi]MBN3469715.1 acyltransferase [Pseudomonas savastanoi pv. phaseolicola]MBN3476733.1 acyltransferase [Pseudomonas savastanoi pv. phaseolicola]RMO24102.1 Acyltransferase 3 [Pseudomonas savastanoi pv. phaseolicola]
MSEQIGRSERIYTLDVLRGIAALSVVFWHWQHFFYVGDQPALFNVARQPFFEHLTILYKYGALAVELFFCISGFVFFSLFFNEIASRKINASRFFINRFSRLYPLHIISFAAVALLQFVYFQHNAVYFIYQYNDFYHAFLNVLMIPAWGMERGWSFNGPVWSVSVEIFLYGLFFIVCLMGKARYLLVPLLIFISWFTYPEYHKLSAGVFSFFSGGLAYLIFARLSRLVGREVSCIMALITMLAGWSIVWLSPGLNIYLLMGVAFPASVMFIASLSYLQPTLMRRFGAIGDVSYSSYLLHFPLQILFAMAFDALGYSREIFYNAWMLLLFMAVLIPLSFASHRFFEAPVQQWLRRRFKAWSIQRATV